MINSFTEPPSFYTIVIEGNTIDEIPGEDIRYKVENGRFIASYGDKIVSNISVNKGDQISVKCKEGEEPDFFCSQVAPIKSGEAEENVGTMLPVVPVSGSVLTKNNMINEDDDNQLSDRKEHRNIMKEYTETDVLTEKDEEKDDKKENKTDDKEKKMSPESKRLDEIRGKVANIKADLDHAKERFEETGETRYEKMIKGLTAKLEKAKKELEAGEEKAKREEERLKKESVDLLEEAVQQSPNELNKKIQTADNYIEGCIAKLKDIARKLATAKNDSDAQKKLLDERAKTEAIQKKWTDIKKDCEDQLKNGPKKSPYKVGMSGSMHSTYGRNVGRRVAAFASADLDDMELSLEAANMEDEIKPLVEELERKGYQVKYASPGHRHLRKKEDREPDGVYYDKLYSDARVMFDKKYSFSETPKYWHWRDVDGCSYLDITPLSYNKDKDGSPDEAFAKWKENYMNSLKTFVKNLKSNTKETTESVEIDFDEMCNELFERVGLNEVLESNIEIEVPMSESKSVIDELDELLK